MFKKIATASLMLLLLPTLVLAATTYNVTYSASPAIAGTVTPVPNAGFGYAKVLSNGTASFKASKNFGYVITGVTKSVANGTLSAVAADGTFTLANVTAANAVTVSYAKAPGVVSASVTPTTQNVSGITSSNLATFTGIYAVTPVGSPTTPVVYTWTVTHTDGTPAPEAHFSGAITGSSVKLYADTYGTYTVTLSVSVAAVPSATYSATATFLAPGIGDSAVCIACHNGRDPAIVADYKVSPHARNAYSSCNGCHVADLTVGMGSLNKGTVSAATFKVLSSTINGVAKGDIYCTKCHNGANAIPHNTNLNAGITCFGCHTDPLGQGNGIGDAHSVKPLPGCVDCHAVQQPQVAANMVNDNNGVRSITQEFGKWSHHVTGVTLNNAHCAACHLEGTIDPEADDVVVDASKHMVDNLVHLRNVADDSEFAWNPAQPNHSNMDNFCMGCHSATGATSTMSQAIQTFINVKGINATGKTASAKNPFGDTISNRYDKMQRPGVTNVNDQFAATNNSHHGVKGPRYSGRTRTAGSRQIASPATFANNSSQLLQGKRSTIYDAGNFNQLYSPLENNGGETAPRTGAATLGDDSTLHCGDCHTVGQWKAGSSETANGSPTPVAIGAHGSNNEYLLRNSIGTDQRHTQNAFLQGNAAGTILMPAGAVAPIPGTNPQQYYTIAVGAAIPYNVVAYTNPTGAFLVCYNCHNYSKYGSVYLQTGLLGGHIGEYDAAGRCNGIGDTIPFNGYTTGTKTDGTQFVSRFMGPITKYSSPAPYLGEQDPEFSNAFGIQCINCHNSGAGNGFGGIHGSAKNTNWTPSATASLNTTPRVVDPSVTGGAYIDGMGNTTKVERFLPGLNNAQHVPGTLGGFTGGSVVPINTAFGPNYTYITGGISSDTNWEQKHWQQTATTNLNNSNPAVPVWNATASGGAGCYTLGNTPNSDTNTTAGIKGPSVTGENGAATDLYNTWGGCVDHTAKRGGGNHGFVKKIVRPITY